MVNKSIIKIVCCLIFSTSLFSCKQVPNEEIDVHSKKNIDENDVTAANENRNFDFLPTSTTNQIVKHAFYTLSYNEQYEQAEWVAYELKKPNESHDFKRPLFIEDNQVKTGSADWRNYKKSGYDKGHLCPAGDMKFSKQAYFDTFLTSNISPQKHEFNDGIWNTLEGKVRYWAAKYNGIYVVTGGVLNKNLKTIGKESVAIPDYFYKVLLDESNGKYKMIGFLVPAQDSNKPLYQFVVSVDEIERLTGIDFYPKLDDKIENQLEKNADYKEWSFN
ncbi:DNA/RNA non-specific endonuclease [Flavobacterium sp. SUN052]|uniref:DNA/RNA non-specific endonuclease n=1 Tax=Flavobacterium sp. SUN052 TaxID=3002441 RepID=UPI00237EC712|nr:DNA/RNA non-specific endonuclease [Flavobacterium sp. SUN052]MEC4004637.1 DNA/RNA non-specific endonuclease [Flavobacterium sp. SUN052]